MSAATESESTPVVFEDVLLPEQDAKEIATTAANINTNFFIFSFYFKMLNNHLLFKTGAKVHTFIIRCTLYHVFFHDLFHFFFKAIVKVLIYVKNWTFSMLL